jgi:hypothetical protein
MRHVFAFALVASAAVLAGCTEEIGVTCPPRQTLCSQVCTYTTFDPNNCGSCGNVCQGQLVCINGQCACQAGLTACGNQCVDTKSSVENCGACGNGCPQSQVCSMSACADTCGAGLTNCNRSCVDTMADSSNCGGCGTKCGQGEKCTAGVCKLECPVGQTSCNGKCANLVNDGNNCGVCGNVCPNEYFCVFGTCILGCPQPLTRCVPDGGNSDGGSQCVDSRWDPNNCGGCGGADVSPQPSASPFMPHVCTVPGGRGTDPVCDNGRCSATCQNGLTDCRFDSGGPARRNPFMSFAPEGNSPSSPPAPSALACFDFANDNCNCGGCGSGFFGQCGIINGINSCFFYKDLDSNNQLTACAWTDPRVAPRDVCCGGQFRLINQNTSCGTSCADAAACGTGAPNCCERSDHTGFACTNTTTDLHNCGGCNFGVPTPSTDCSLVPFPSSSPFPGCCGGGCDDLNNNANNCGACGTACPSPSPGAIPGCCPNRVNRGAGNPTGGCLDFNSDANNCGSCGHGCVADCAGRGGCTSNGCSNGSCQCVCP